MGGEDVVQFAVQVRERLRLFLAKLTREELRVRDEIVSMPLSRRSRLPGRFELLRCVLANRVQEERSAAIRIQHDKRFLDQPSQQIQDVAFRDAGLVRDRFRRLDGQSTRKHGETAQQRPFAIIEQLVAPVDERAQRLLARKRRAVAIGEELKAIAQARCDLVQ